MIFLVDLRTITTLIDSLSTISTVIIFEVSYTVLNTRTWEFTSECFLNLQIQDLLFNRDGDIFFSTGNEISRDSSDRNIMAWDFRSTSVLSNQIYQVLFHVL